MADPFLSSPAPRPESVALGKLSPREFERVLAPRLGASRPEVLVGPGVGVDAAIVRLGAGRVMAVATDPLSLIPALGPALSARLACHMLASDIWVTGIPPAYAAINFNLPPGFPEETLGLYWEAMSAEWETLGVAVVTGHTGRYQGCGLTIVGAGTLIGVGDEGRFVGPEFVRPGDRVLVTKGCAIETTAIAARLFPRRLGETLEPEGIERARSTIEWVSVVDDCRALIPLGVRGQGVTCLHDATEGGVLGGLFELARSTGLDLRVEQGRIPMSTEARAVCRALGIDPYWALSSGSLIVSVGPDHARRALAALEEAGIPAAVVGEVVSGSGVLWLTAPDGSVRTIEQPEPDPYWPAYARAVREGWE